MSNLFKSLSDYNNSVEKSKTIYSGLLGLLVEGERQVQHPSRNSFVYVRLRDNLSEVIQAFNDKVSPVYDLPVLLERRNNIWYVTGRDIDRYQNWGSSAPFLPKHGSQHSFNRDENTGGDVVPIYPDQFMPLLVYPSGTVGSGNLIVAPYMLQRDSDFIYVGNTGTIDVLGYKPTNNQAILGLVYLDTVSGNPGVLIGSGTPFSASITGSSQIYPYIPYPTSTDHEPLYAFRLVSGTSSLTWDNLYNVRQFIGGVGGGSGGGTGSFPTFDPNSVVITDASGNIITDPKALYSIALNLLSFGGDPLGIISTLTDALTFMATDGISAQNIMFSYGTGVRGRFGGVTGRGTKASPTALQDGDTIATFFGRFHYDSGGTPTPTQAEIRLVVDGTPASGDYPTRLEFYTTPDGSSTMTLHMTIKNNGQLILGAYGSGTHTGTPTKSLAVDASGDVIELNLDGWIPVSETWTRTGNHTFTVSGNLTDKYRKGCKVRYRDGGGDEYGVINSSSHSSGTTTVQLVPNTDYAMASATITDTYISIVAQPDGIPREFNFTPSFTNLTVGNATVLAKWRNDLKYLRVHVIFGNSTSVGGSITMATPFDTETIIGFPRVPVGVATLLDASPLGTTLGNVVMSAANTLLLQAVANNNNSAGNAYIPIGGLSSAIPFTWATSDEISFFAALP